MSAHAAGAGAAPDGSDAPAGGLPPLRLATRGSALALAQSTMIGEQLAAATGRRLELVEVTTRGDVDRAPLAQIGGTGVFVAAVREALADGRADVAVHSLKDLPTAADPRLSLAAVPPREDPRDALVARDADSVTALPHGARVGTGSPRRRAQLAAARPDLELVDLRGNVDTRIARVDGDAGRAVAADLDAVVLATAGLRRLGRASRISALLDPEVMLPAPGQGALAVEVSADLPTRDPGAGPALVAALRDLDDPATRAAVTAERVLLAALEAGCSAPVGALAQVVEASAPAPELGVEASTSAPEPAGELPAEGAGGRRVLHLRGLVAGPDGSLHRAEATGPFAGPDALGRAVAQQLLAQLAAASDPGARSPAAATPSTTGTTSTTTTSTARTTSARSTTSPRPTTHRGSPPR